MNIEARSFDRKTDVRDACGKLTLKAGGRTDAEELAAIYLYIVDCGAIATAHLGKIARDAMALRRAEEQEAERD